MATLTVNGQKVKVDDSFLSMSPQEQEATVNEIAASLGHSPSQTQFVPPSGAQPGSREYADWALAQARAGRALPQVSETPPEVANPYSDLGGKAIAAGGSFIEGVPIAGPTLLGMAQQARGAIQGMSPEQVQSEFDAVKEANPITSIAGNVAGSVAALAPLGATAVGGRLLGTAGSLPMRVGMGAASGAAISGADTLARGGSLEDARNSSLVGGGLGMVFPAAGGIKNALGNKAAQKAATTAAIANAPAAADLKAAARSMFKAVDDAGVTVDTNKFSQFVQQLAQTAKKERINPTLDKNATGAFQELIGALDDVQRNGGALTVSDLHTLRQVAQAAAKSSEGRDAYFAQKIIDGLDDFVVSPGATKLPANQIGNGNTAAGNELLKAISTWARARKAGIIEDAMYKAQNAASGFENGLRAEFRKLLNNDRTRKLFSKVERDAIEDVVRGTASSNIAKLIGKFGFGGGSASNMLGGSIGSGIGATIGSAFGPFGSLFGAAVAGGGASLARKASEKLTEKAADRAAKIVATPNILQLTPRAMPPAIIPPAVLPLLATERR